MTGPLSSTNRVNTTNRGNVTRRANAPNCAKDTRRARGVSCVLRRWSGLWVIAALVGLLLPASSASAQLRGRFIRVGLFEGANPIIREGEWCFAEVELRYNGTEPFDGELRVEQRDRDGDVVISKTPIALTPDGNPRPFAVYFVPQDIGASGRMSVSIFDESGKLARILDDTGQEQSELWSEPVSGMSPDEYLIVDLTVPRKLPHVRWLDSDLASRYSDSVNRRRVRAMAPGELPARWQGLSVVDAIVWDNADPTLATDLQLDALVEWVRRGGRLLITSGSNWQALSTSMLARVLPVSIDGEHQTTEALEFGDIVPGDQETVLQFERAYMRNPITRCDMTALPGSLPIPRTSGNDPIAYRRTLGRGMLTFVGASLHELLPAPARLGAIGEDGGALGDGSERKRPADEPFVQVCEAVVGQNFLQFAPEVKTEDSVFSAYRDLFGEIRKSVGFEARGAAFLVFAILFAIAYFLIASVGSYWYLKRKSLEHHCWTAFALVGVVGSVIGTGLVWTLRGFTMKLEQTTIVDARAGSDMGYATCLFGVKTPDHTRLHLRLPIDGGSGPEARSGAVRGMPEYRSLDAGRTEFVAPESYACLLAGADLVDVPLRATLKEFIGAWRGPIGGTVDGRLKMRRISVEGSAGRVLDVADTSFIRNRLGVTLKNCYLLESASECDERAAAGGINIRCYALGDLAAEGPNSEWDAEALRRLMFFARPNRLQPNAPLKRLGPRALALSRQVSEWRKALRVAQVNQFGLQNDKEPVRKLTANDLHSVLLMLSTYDFIQHDKGVRLSRSHGRPLGCTHLLTPQTAILMGYTNEPPTATLEVDESSLRPSKSHTMYRFVIPVERSD